MVGGQRDPGLERQWRERVAGWAASGLSVRAFCRQHGLIETSFYFWKRELRARDAAALAAPVIASTKSPARKRPLAKKSPPVFVPVTVMAAATVSVEVRCPSGHVVLLSGCEIASLSSLFAALASLTREARPC